MKVCMCKNCYRQYIIEPNDKNNIINCKCGNKINIEEKSIDVTEDYIIDKIETIDKINKLEGLTFNFVPFSDLTYIILLICYNTIDNRKILNEFVCK